MNAFSTNFTHVYLNSKYRNRFIHCFLFYSLLAFTNNLLANYSSLNLSCKGSHHNDQYLTLEPLDEGSTRLNLTEFQFEGSPFIEKRLSCARWLESLIEVLGEFEIPKHDIKVFSNNNDNAEILKARLLKKTSKKMYDYCNNHPSCKIRFPYNLNLGYKIFLAKNKKEIFSNSQNCLQKTQNNEKIEINDFRKHINKTELITTWISPPDSFLNQSLDINNNSNNDVIIISTLGASLTALKELKKNLKPHNNALVLIDSYIYLTDPALDEIMALNSNNFWILPIFNTPFFARAYHIKSATSLNGDVSVITSSNLKNMDNLFTYDFGITLMAPNLGKSWSNTLLLDIMDNCQNPAFMHCNLEQRYSSISIEKKIITDQYYEICSKILNNSTIKNIFNKEIDETILSSQIYDIEKLILKMAKETKKNVKILTHHFNNYELINEMAKNTNAKIDVYHGKEIPNNPNTNKNINYNYLISETLENHVKAIIFDEKLVMFGTGNFTHSGLTRSREIFIVFENEKLAKDLNNYIKIFK